MDPRAYCRTLTLQPTDSSSVAMPVLLAIGLGDCESRSKTPGCLGKIMGEEGEKLFTCCRVDTTGMRECIGQGAS